MNRALSFLLVPEVVVALFTAAFFLFCARHSSRSPRDLELLVRAMWLLPLVAVPLAFATIFAPGGHSGWWLARVNIAVSLALLVCSIKIANTYGPVGSGRTGAGNGLIIVLTLGIVVGALANAAAGALVLAELQPAFAAWFQARKFVAGLLTLLAAVPIGFAMTLVIGAVVSVVIAVFALFNR